MKINVGEIYVIRMPLSNSPVRVRIKDIRDRNQHYTTLDSQVADDSYRVTVQVGRDTQTWKGDAFFTRMVL